MKNKKSIYIIVSISLFVGLLHVVIGPDYQGVFRHFIRGYLIDILLPMNLYLLLQVALRKKMPVATARITGAIFTFGFGIGVEILQYYKVGFLGRTYDIWDIFMYGVGTGLGVVIDYTIIARFESRQKEK